MKVTLDLDELLDAGRISKEEYSRLTELSKKETKGHAFAVAVALAAIAVIAGLAGMFPSFFEQLGKALVELFGARGLHLLAILLSAVGALRVGSGFLASLSALLILTFVGNTGLFYTHATYWVAVEEPMTTSLLFSALAAGSFNLSKELKPKPARAALIFSRTCVFFVNIALWVGSLWGDKQLGQGADVVYAAVWAFALIATGVWAAREDRRWLVNTSAVFGSIHFYTQWFERLGASPGSLLTAGVLALGILYQLRAYNLQASARRAKSM